MSARSAIAGRVAGEAIAVGDEEECDSVAAAADGCEQDSDSDSSGLLLASHLTGGRIDLLQMIATSRAHLLLTILIIVTRLAQQRSLNTDSVLQEISQKSSVMTRYF